MSISVLVAGDYCPRSRVTKAFEQGNYSMVLSGIKEEISITDFSIVNFECVVASDDNQGIVKCGVSLRTFEYGVKALQWAGFKCVTLANNHTFDFGESGLFNTINECHACGISTVGAGKDLLDASRVFFERVNNRTIAVINCCEREFSQATNKTAGCNPLNVVSIYYSILEARKKADFVLLIIHGGNEYYPLPSPRMKQTYRFFIDAGADAVINHHQHCFSGYEVYQNKPIFYGLGNFCFDEAGKSESWYEGYMVKLLFGDSITFDIIPYIQCSSTPSVVILHDEEKKEILNKVSNLNKIIQNDQVLNDRYNSFITTSNELMKDVFSPFSGRVMRYLNRAFFYPLFCRRAKRLELLSYIQCESHYPKVINFLSK